MDQSKTGKFICELRKQQNLTQKQLAEKLGISDRTVSKWETGGGMPDISLMLPLCGELGVSVNELLSGERLSPENYNEKAEENIMKLLDETNNNKSTRSGIIAAAVGLLLIGVYFWLYFARNIDKSLITLPMFYPETLLFEFGLSALLLGAARLLGSFFRAFPLAFTDRSAGAAELRRSEAALSLVSKTVLFANLLMFMINLTMINIGINDYGVEIIVDSHGNIDIHMCFDYIIMWFIVYLVLLPVRTRLKLKIDEAEKK